MPEELLEVLEIFLRSMFWKGDANWIDVLQIVE